jgi:predicted transcriptional regulator
MAILRVLWQRGPSSVRDVLAAVNEQRAEPLAYTTVLQFLRIMTDKGLVVRDERDRAHAYRPSVPAERTKRQIVGDLIDRVFAGSAAELVLQALGSKKVNAEELAEIRQLLNQLGTPKK